MTEVSSASTKFNLHELAAAKARSLGYIIPNLDDYGPQPDPWITIFIEADSRLNQEMIKQILNRNHPETWDIDNTPLLRKALKHQQLFQKYLLPKLLAQAMLTVINNSLLQAAVTGTTKAAETYWSKWLSDLPDICPTPRRKIPWPGPWPPIAGLDIDLPDFIITFAAALQLEVHRQMETAIHKNIHAAAEKILNTLNKA